LISQRFKKQHTVSHSSAEAEYRVIAYLVTETLWIYYVLAELGILLDDLMKVLCDKISATYITANPVFYDWGKYIMMDYYLFVNVSLIVIFLSLVPPQ